MSYTALYRRWRPKAFNEVIGQEAVCRALKNQVRSGRTAHAYLFCGTRGTGKTSLAKIMARAVNCENPIDGEPCNKCAACISIMNEASMNVIEMDAASNTGVDDMRAIKEQTIYPPTSGKYKVFIIDEVHMISPSAFNALLKTLEEPPEYVIFILATTEVHKIPVTVTSRCQRYDLRRISLEAIVSRVSFLCKAEGIEIEAKAMEYIAKRADGAMRDALSLLDECVSFNSGNAVSYEDVLEILGTADISIFNRLFEAVINFDAAKALDIVSEAFIQGKEAGRFVTDFMWYLRNLLIIKSTDTYSNIIDLSSENLKILSGCAAEVSKPALIRYIRSFAELANRLKFSESKRIIVEIALIKLCTPEMDFDKEAIFERIADLEQRFEKFLQKYNTNISLPGIQTSVNTTVNADSDIRAEKQPVKKVIPKAEYEDFMMLKKDWSRLVEELGGAAGPFFRDTYIEPAGKEMLNIVFTQKDYYNWASREAYLELIKEKARLSYGREFEFKTKLENEYERANTQYVSEEDILNNINMEIDIEN